MSLLRNTALAASAILLIAAAAMADSSREVLALKSAFEAMRAKDWGIAIARARDAGDVGLDIIEWHRLRQDKGKFRDYQTFLKRRADWPGLPLLQKSGESTIPEDAPPDVVVEFFKSQPPQTGAGSLRLAAAHRAMGRIGDAEADLVLAWRSQSLSANEHGLFTGAGANLLKPHHTARLDMLLWRGADAEARRMLPLVPNDWRALAEARLALRKNGKGVDALIEAVPKQLAKNAGLAFERFQWRAKKGRNADAIEILLAQSESAEALGEPLRWSGWRRSLARAEMRAGRHMTAYRIAAGHHLSEGSNYSDLEWLSGYLALRFLGDPERALDHFQRFRAAVFTPISLGRAGYWQGRALEAMGDNEGAKAAYAEGAKYQTSFYGLLAAEKANISMQSTIAGAEAFPPWQEAGFMSSSVIAAALMLYEAGERSLARRFMLHIGESLTREELGQLGDLALALEDQNIAIMVGKLAARMGHVIPTSYYALHPMANSELAVAPELALAIARRESEFDPGVVSGAGARGMMQLMPGTASAVAGRLEIEYSAGRLLTDWRYNTRLGSTYLAELEKEFGKNHVLVSAAYNAGPSRARRWIEANGDPRSAGTDVIDWIEHIPFRETRNYVMRVMESLPVYRARIAGAPQPIRLSEELHAR